MGGPGGRIEITPAPDNLRRIIQLQTLTILWMTVEVVVALGTAWAARSPALLAFGGDSAVELLSASVVFWRFRSEQQSMKAESIAGRAAGGLLFIVAGFVVVTSTLSLFEYREPRPSLVGILLLIVAAVAMPQLAQRKRALASQVASAALRADATESALCGYLAWIALAGLLASSIFRAPWADPIAALALVPLIVREGWQVIREPSHCCKS